MAKVAAKCSCETKVGVRGMKAHMRGPWHRCARDARALRKLGLSYKEVYRQISKATDITYERVRTCLQADGL